MEHLEHLERERYGFLCLGGVLSFIALLICGANLFYAFFGAVSLGLLAGGTYVAWKTTSEFIWAHVVAEAKINGGTPSKWGVWFGNLIPSPLVLALGIWLGRA